MDRPISSKVLNTGLTLFYRENSSDLFIMRENDYTVFPDKEDIFMDVGGYIGDIPLKFGMMSKEMHSYEPMQDSFELLKKNIEFNNLTNCFAYNVALGNTSGETQIYFGEKHKSSHMSISKIKVRGRTEISVKQLDFSEEFIRIQPTFLKMDIEGAEYEILENIDLSLLENLSKLVIEFHPQMVENGYERTSTLEKELSSMFKVNSRKEGWYFKKLNTIILNLEK